MNQPNRAMPSLAEIEREVVAESREWGRQRLQERLQQLADKEGEVFPPRPTQASRSQSAQRAGKGKSGR